MRQAAGETTQEDPERRQFRSCHRSGSHERCDAPCDVERRWADDGEAQDSRYQPGRRGTEERVEEAMHWVFLVDQIVERLAVDEHLGGCKGRPREHRSCDALESKARSEWNGVNGNLVPPVLVWLTNRR